MQRDQQGEAHVCTDIHTHSYAPTCSRAHMHAYTDARTHTHTHASQGHVLKELIPLCLSGKHDVTAFVLELHQDLCQFVVKLGAEGRCQVNISESGTGHAH